MACPSFAAGTSVRVRRVQVLLIALLFILRRGRKKKVIEVVPDTTADSTAPVGIEEQVLEAVGAVGKTNKPIAQPIVEDPQKVYIRDQITNLGKSNPATVAQLIQTWMDEDRRN